MDEIDGVSRSARQVEVRYLLISASRLYMLLTFIINYVQI
jgi:hypothetical protein